MRCLLRCLLRCSMWMVSVRSRAGSRLVCGAPQSRCLFGVTYVKWLPWTVMPGMARKMHRTCVVLVSGMGNCCAACSSVGLLCGLVRSQKVTVPQFLVVLARVVGRWVWQLVMVWSASMTKYQSVCGVAMLSARRKRAVRFSVSLPAHLCCGAWMVRARLRAWQVSVRAWACSVPERAWPSG